MKTINPLNHGLRSLLLIASLAAGGAALTAFCTGCGASPDGQGGVENTSSTESTGDDSAPDASDADGGTTPVRGTNVPRAEPPSTPGNYVGAPGGGGPGAPSGGSSPHGPGGSSRS